ncbi:hypothetical protein [Solwaraspora sp. WMMA2065]|uniref:hypothetical protein n=1 Tax=Solwaraspora sp. WMMA2065 TaxID=3015166 RepID=UPI00259BC4A9|nr:hypothetical protein [Solwaraspora sp. WMMA2065]WJK37434.1 hypothetical protein O7610_14435 [Solwaraspora sp. WMMA2065]
MTVALTLICGLAMVPQLRYDWLSGLAFFSLVMLLINCPLRWWSATPWSSWPSRWACCGSAPTRS